MSSGKGIKEGLFTGDLWGGERGGKVRMFRKW
jgi:hypothetical protein